MKEQEKKEKKRAQCQCYKTANRTTDTRIATTLRSNTKPAAELFLSARGDAFGELGELGAGAVDALPLPPALEDAGAGPGPPVATVPALGIETLVNDGSPLRILVCWDAEAGGASASCALRVVAKSAEADVGSVVDKIFMNGETGGDAEGEPKLNLYAKSSSVTVYKERLVD